MTNCAASTIVQPPHSPGGGLDRRLMRGIGVEVVLLEDGDHIVGGIWQRDDDLVDGWRGLCVDVSSLFSLSRLFVVLSWYITADIVLQCFGRYMRYDRDVYDFV